MFLEIAIPTLNRRTKLLNCLRSIEKTMNDYNKVKVFVYFSDIEELNSFPIKKNWLELRIVEKYRASTLWNSHLKTMKGDILFCCNDDVELLEDTIDKIFINFKFYFPDFDGVIGVNQSNIPKNQAVASAFSVIGSKFADRFRNREVFCPEYHRLYLDTEMGKYASKLNKFQFCEDCKIIHHHPVFEPQLNDSTHTQVRKWLSKDRETFINRQSLGLLWGESYSTLKG